MLHNGSFNWETFFSRSLIAMVFLFYPQKIIMSRQLLCIQFSIGFLLCPLSSSCMIVVLFCSHQTKSYFDKYLDVLRLIHYCSRNYVTTLSVYEFSLSFKGTFVVSMYIQCTTPRWQFKINVYIQFTMRTASHFQLLLFISSYDELNIQRSLRCKINYKENITEME